MEKIKICHFSDNHSYWKKMPAADLYICTGDCLPNYSEVKQNINSFRFERFINKEIENKKQKNWLQSKKSLRQYLTNTNAPVAIVRGNHDFTDLAEFFGGNVFEVNNNSERAIEFCGLKIGGMRGINNLCYEWADEYLEHELYDISYKLPCDLDILITHAPPYDILDKCYGMKLGVQAIRSYITNVNYNFDSKLKLHCFGHIHEASGIEVHNDIIFSNAATLENGNMVELEI